MKNMLTLEAFAEFCESKPAHEEYDYFDLCKCAVAQYAAHLGIHYTPTFASNALDATFWQRAEWEAAPSLDDEPVWGALASRLRLRAAS